MVEDAVLEHLFPQVYAEKDMEDLKPLTDFCE